MKTKLKRNNAKNLMDLIYFIQHKIIVLRKKIILFKTKLKPKDKFIKTIGYIQKKPYTSFLSVFAVFFILLIIGNLLFAPKPALNTTATTATKVDVFKLGSAPLVSYQGKVEKSGVVKIVAQMPGVVNSINFTEGQNIYKGSVILRLASNYQGGNVLSISRQISQVQYENAKQNYDTQKDLITKQKELTDKNKDNIDQLKDITNKTADDTQNVINYNQSIIDTLNQTLTGLGTSDPLYIQTKAQIAQFQSANLQLNSTLRNLQYQGASDKPPSDLANLQKDIAIKGLDLQTKALDMSLEITRLSYNLASVNEANMYPASPFNGVVDRILVHVGEFVNPGTVLAYISGTNQYATIVVNLPGEIAKNISKIEPSILKINNKDIYQTPAYISKDATSGNLYSVIYDLDDSMTQQLIDESFISVQIPIGVADATDIVPFIPLDAVIQTQEEAYIFIVDKNMTAKVKKVSLGQIQGRFVEILSALSKNTQVILNRNIIEGDKVEIAR